MTYISRQQFYDDPDLYDKVLYSDLPYEADYFVNKVKKYKQVLYLGVGSGRIMKKLYDVNKNIVGIELSEKMCQKAKSIMPDAQIIHADALTAELNCEFNLVLAPYEFLNHFNEKSLDILFSNVCKHLKNRGLFVVQVKNPFECVDKGSSANLTQMELYDNNILEKNYVSYSEPQKMYFDYIERIDLNTNEDTLIKMDWYYYFVDDLKKLGSKYKLIIKKIYGNFDQTKFKKDSPVLLVEFLK